MAKKHKKAQKQPSFAQVMAEIRTPKIAAEPAVSPVEPKIDAAVERSVNNEVDAEHFRWCFIDDEMRWNNNFSFKCYKNDLKKFLQEIEKPIYDKFCDMTWAQVNNIKHCGKYRDNLSKDQRAIACSPHKPDDEHLYHIHISQRHVLFGYRLNNVFHITINDPTHEFDNL